MPRRRSVAFTHPAVDGLLMGGASVLAFAVCGAAQGGPLAARLSALAVAGAAVLVNGAHFAATNHRLYRKLSSARQFPLTAALVPLVVLAGVIASLRWPYAVAPYFVKLFLFWSPYHYSGQTVGLSLLYCRRAGVKLDELERRALSLFVYGTFAASAARAEVGLTHRDYLGLPYPSLGLPPWAATAAAAGMAVCGLGLAALWARRRRRGQGVPLLAWLPPLAQFLWFIPGPSVPSFYALVPMFHGAQYLLVAWYLNQREREDETGRSGRVFAAAETARFAAWNLALYWAMFELLPRAATAATGQPAAFVIPVAIAGVQLHHFFVDGVIWRLRTPALAQILAPQRSEGASFRTAAAGTGAAA